MTKGKFPKSWKGAGVGDQDTRRDVKGCPGKGA
jgi:hypothetical protein